MILTLADELQTLTNRVRHLEDLLESREAEIIRHVEDKEHYRRLLKDAGLDPR